MFDAPMPPVGATPQELQAHITELRKKIAADRDTYNEWKAWLRLEYPDLWEPVGACIIARAHYYRGEILRAKHNLARYMRGEDVKEQHKFVEMWLDDLERHLSYMYTSIIEMQDNYQKLKKVGLTKPLTMEEMEKPDVDVEQWRASGLNHLSELGIGMATDSFKDLKQTLERYTYGG